jgi:phage terminase large subunit GpA-like protein
MNISATQKSNLTNLRRKSLRLLKPPPKFNVWEWAEARRRLSKEVTPKPGKYKTENTPFQRKPQESFTDSAVQVTVLMWASRLGKTEMINNLDGYLIDNDPSGILVVYPKIDSAKKWSKEFFTPMVKATPCLRGKIRAARLKDADNTVLSKRFPGGKISAIGANSPSDFRQIQARAVQCDEIDAMETTVEGDPITLAFKRADNYPNSIQVLSSTPTIKGFSRIETWMNRSDFQMWFCPCPKCGEFQVLKWDQVKYNKEKPEEAYYECESFNCKAKLNDDDRVAMVKAGEWRGTQPFKGIRGYWLNGLNSTMPAKKGYVSKMHQFVGEYLESVEQGKEALRVWENTFLSKTYEEECDSLEATPLLKRREDYTLGLMPDEAMLITCGVDVQKDRLELEFVAWAKGEESWGLGYHVIPGNPYTDKPWKALDELLSTKKWAKADGMEFMVAATAIDTGNFAKPVYAYCRPRYAKRIFAIKGVGGPGKPVVGNFSRANRGKVILYPIGTDTAKSTIYGYLKLSEGPGFMHYSRLEAFGYGEDYFKGLTSEKIVVTYHFGHPRKRFEKPDHARNEPLDTRVYALGALHILQPDWILLTKNLARKQKVYTVRTEKTEPDENAKEESQQKQEPSKPIQPQRKSFVSRRPGFVNSWKKKF